MAPNSSSLTAVKLRFTLLLLSPIKAKAPRGASAFIVEKDTPGFTFGKKEKKMGIRASATRELVFRNCLIPAENLINKEGMGFIVTMKVLDNSRPGISAQALGIAQGAMETAVDYTRQRIQFGQPLISLPVVQYKLADMAIQVEAARALVYAVARTIDSGVKSFTEESAMAKVFASDVGHESYHRCRANLRRRRLYARLSPGKNDARRENYPDL